MRRETIQLLHSIAFAGRVTSASEPHNVFLIYALGIAARGVISPSQGGLALFYAVMGGVTSRG